ncbi:winged helix-turn-helix domain-containing protein [Homoserinibacter sp. GY 40078]|uniref:winged helix-turn-helix domain-containing protein n=1 Tax=Homoserinibacter sp. GY 40078 TaxID=2603275 RepID=UPI0011CBFA1D|nr:winged helix-turn-helix domain-containing protein [Homoserinibacter sp. GY 40078]TXK19296.1 GAF domain-containing protein [Homoserinibacter sp. GY 40078]
MSRLTSLSSLVAQGLTGRDAAVVGPAVMCAEPGSAAAGLKVRIGRGAWPSVVVTSPAEAAHAAAERDARLILVGGDSVDWMVQTLRMLRATGETPIAVLDADVRDGAELALLDAGANLVIDRTVSPRELSARLVGLVRARSGEERLRVRWLQAEGLSVDVATRSCTLDDEHLALSRHDFELLFLLMSNAGRVVSHQQLAQQLWDDSDEDAQNALRLAVTRLRRRLGDSSDRPRWIASVRGVGYRFLPRVAEIGDNRNDDRMRSSLARLTAQADALAALTDALAATRDVQAVAETVVTWAVARGLADASTVFRLDRAAEDGARAVLVASSGMSSRWRQTIASGHPMSGAFIGSRIYGSGETVQLSDISNLAGRFPVTARMSTAEDLHACVLFPLHVGDAIWGDLAFLSRSTNSFSPAVAAFFRTISTIVSIAISAVDGETRAEGLHA